jgi:hypothetical protein
VKGSRSAAVLLCALACAPGVWTALHAGPVEHAGARAAFRADTAGPYTLVLDDLPTVRDARKEYRQWLDELEELLEDEGDEPYLEAGVCGHPGSAAATPCRFLGDTVEGQATMYYLRPHPVPGFSDIEGLGGSELYQLLVPAKEAADRGALQRWRAQADAGGVVDCGGYRCRVVYVVSADAAVTDTALALCAVERTAYGYGAPSRCAVLALVEDGNAWVRATVERVIPCSGCTGAGPGDVIDLASIEPPAMSMAPVSGALEQAVVDRLQARLRAPPLALATEMIHGQLRAGAPPRVSQVLPGWREEVAMYVWMGRDGRDELSVRGSIVLLVNRQNTDRDQDWHRPGPGQQAAYGGLVLDRFRLAFRDACPGGRWRDDFHYVCGGGGEAARAPGEELQGAWR